MGFCFPPWSKNRIKEFLFSAQKNLKPPEKPPLNVLLMPLKKFQKVINEKKNFLLSPKTNKNKKPEKKKRKEGKEEGRIFQIE